MSEEILEKLVADFIRLGFAVSGFAWQGGEPTLMGLDFYKMAVELQREYGAPGQQLSNKLQTNGVLLAGSALVFWLSSIAEIAFHVSFSLCQNGELEIYWKHRLVNSLHRAKEEPLPGTSRVFRANALSVIILISVVAAV